MSNTYIYIFSICIIYIYVIFDICIYIYIQYMYYMYIYMFDIYIYIHIYIHTHYIYIYTFYTYCGFVPVLVPQEAISGAMSISQRVWGAAHIWRSVHTTRQPQIGLLFTSQNKSTMKCSCSACDFFWT